LGEISPFFGQFFMALGEFFSRKNRPKTWLGDFLGDFSLSLGDFFSKTSGHPGQSQPNQRTFKMLPAWVSSWFYQQMLDYTAK
jgi:hypothetical protein